MTNREAHDILAEHQKWRRGEGKYEWHEEPSENAPMPYSAKLVGEALDKAMQALDAVAELSCENR